MVMHCTHFLEAANVDQLDGAYCKRYGRDLEVFQDLPLYNKVMKKQGPAGSIPRGSAGRDQRPAGHDQRPAGCDQRPAGRDPLPVPSYLAGVLSAGRSVLAGLLAAFPPHRKAAADLSGHDWFLRRPVLKHWGTISGQYSRTDISEASAIIGN